MPDDWRDLKAELEWCIENGCHGPRTERALRWAAEAIEEQEARAVIAAAEEREKAE
jgi:hypothetical protein